MNRNEKRKSNEYLEIVHLHIVNSGMVFTIFLKKDQYGLPSQMHLTNHISDEMQKFTRFVFSPKHSGFKLVSID